MKVFYDKDADLRLIKGKKVTILGYGSQGHAHSLNLKDSGVQVTVGLRKGGSSWDKAKKAGLEVKEMSDAVNDSDFVIYDRAFSKLFRAIPSKPDYTGAWLNSGNRTNCLIKNVREVGIVASSKNVRELKDTDLRKLPSANGGGDGVND